jgi:phosphohistidine swiveling domain-containing protein
MQRHGGNSESVSRTSKNTMSPEWTTASLDRHEVWVLAGQLNDDGLPVPFCPVATSVLISQTLPTFFRLLGADCLLPLAQFVRAMDGFYYVDVAAVRSFLGGRVPLEVLIATVKGKQAGAWGVSFRALPLRFKVLILQIMARITLISLRDCQAGDQAVAAFQEHVESQRRHNQNLHSTTEIGQELMAMMQFQHQAACRLLQINLYAGFDVFYHLLAAFLRRWYADTDGALLHALLADLPGMKSHETSLALASLGAAVLADPTAAHVLLDEGPAQFDEFARSPRCSPELRARIERFLATYGHRGMRESDLIAPRWAEEPTQVYALLRGHAVGKQERPPTGGALTSDPLDRAIGSAKRTRWRMIQELLLRRLVRLARCQAVLRDNSRFYLLQYAHLMRQLLLALGAPLQVAGLLEDQQAVFFLEFQELQALSQTTDQASLDWATLQAQVQARQQAYHQVLGHQPPETLNHTTGVGILPRQQRPALADQAPLTGLLVGLAASSGRRTGTALVVRDPLDSTWAARANSETILVATYGNLSWAYLFPILAGLVLEQGGILSHVAILAREYGIPLVVGVTGATLKITDEAKLIVDGQAGTVTVLPPIPHTEAEPQ